MHGRLWWIGGPGEIQSSRPRAVLTRSIAAMVEHTVKGIGAMVASRSTWYNILFSFPIMFLFMHNLCLMLQEVVHKRPFSALRAWMHGRQMEEPTPEGATHFGKTMEYVSDYSSEYIRVHGEGSNPEEAEIDPKVVLLAGEGKPHGRHNILDSMIHTDMTYSQVRPSTSRSTKHRARPLGATVSVFSFSSFF